MLRTTGRFDNWTGIVVTIAFVVIGGASGADAAAVTVPSTADYEDIGGQIVLAAQLDGSVQQRLVLDTGARYLHLLPDKLKGLTLELAPAVKSPSPNWRMVKVRTLRLGSLLIQNRTAEVGDLPGVTEQNKKSPGTAIDGSLGMNILKDYAVGIDPGAQVISFWKGGHLGESQVQRWFDEVRIPIPQSDLVWSLLPGASATLGGKLVRNPSDHHPRWTIIPMHYDQDPLSPTADALIDGQKVDLNLDTGTTALLLPASVARKMNPRTLLGSPAATVFGSIPATLAVLHSMQVGGLRITNPYAMIAEDSSAEPIPPLCGLDVLNRSAFVIDFPDNTIYVSEPPPASRPSTTAIRPQVGIGVSLERQKAGLVVISTSPHSPARLAGIQPGEVVVAVNGSPVGNRSADTIETLWKKPRGTPIVLRLHRSGSGRTYTVPLRVAALEGTGTGVGAQRRRNRLFVQGVLPFLPAQKAGVQVGDEILTVNGKPATKVTEDDAGGWGWPAGTVIRLTLRRSGSPMPVSVELPVVNVAETMLAVLKTPAADEMVPRFELVPGAIRGGIKLTIPAADGSVTASTPKDVGSVESGDSKSILQTAKPIVVHSDGGVVTLDGSGGTLNIYGDSNSISINQRKSRPAHTGPTLSIYGSAGSIRQSADHKSIEVLAGKHEIRIEGNDGVITISGRHTLIDINCYNLTINNHAKESSIVNVTPE